MRLFSRGRRARTEKAPIDGESEAEFPAVPVELRIAGELFSAVLRHTTDHTRGEEAGFILCSESRGEGRNVLLARRWLPVPEEEIIRHGGRFVLEWTAAFNTKAIEIALEMGCSLVLVHYHGGPAPELSGDDRRSANELFPSASRLLDRRLSGTVVLGDSSGSGSFWRDGRRAGELDRLRIVSDHLEDHFVRAEDGKPLLRERLNRQSLAIGSRSESILSRSTVAVVGASGGGSHVIQQLLHQGVGTLVVVDEQIVDESNLGRLVGSEIGDIDKTPKTEVARRLAHRIDPKSKVVAIQRAFPHPDAVAALKTADILVACVDTWRIREQLNEFCRRYHIPYVDIGINIETDNEQLNRADGQLIVVTPDAACLRCLPILSDQVLAREREDRPPGYERNPDATGDPQVVSMNGTLASEASNAVLDLLTGYSGGKRGPGWWQYDGRGGSFDKVDPPRTRRQGCPACAQLGHGDPLR